jgi:hypothetical protein
VKTCIGGIASRFALLSSSWKKLTHIAAWPAAPDRGARELSERCVLCAADLVYSHSKEMPFDGLRLTEDNLASVGPGSDPRNLDTFRDQGTFGE